MTEGWTSKALEEFARFRNGKSIKPGTTGAYPVYGSNGLIGSADEFMYEAAIILGRVGAYCGSVELSEGKFWASDNTIVVEAIPDEADLWFLYYLLKDANLNQHAGGAAQPLLTQSRLKPLQYSIPSLSKQRQIASILRIYDDLIENNTRRIEILEEMARRLYEEWFVHFRFPGHEKVSFKESELGEIPEGWCVKTVAETFQIMGGGTPSKKVPEYWDGGDINWFSPTDLTKSSSAFMEESSSKITELGLKKSSAKMFPEKSVMMTSRATIGVVAINTQPATTNQGFITCLPNDEFPLNLMYHWLKDNVETFISLGTGATFKEISKGTFKEIQLVVPPHDVSRAYEEAVNPMMQQVLLLQRKNANLRAQRDLLLPKLVSGEIDVSDIPMPENKEVEAA
ncbi:restriction endonuclease subunit S [Klebsiella quasipneumoniae]|uniref:restriction endonuclease subunit S n=1 Tax=Klebsiella quasipneumoniae TaxID=1463165 RepID=UPI0029DD095D|nr:restriction endonuclease subunit S [Cronobacter malonaticus]HCM7852096.1 restriction endonuclease subunit S [Klebsiella pneumoniae]